MLMLPFAVLALLLYCGGFFALLSYACFKVATGGAFAKEGFQTRWKFLFIKFRPEQYYWGLVHLLRGFAINMGFSIFENGLKQTYWVLNLECFYLLLTLVCMPYRHITTNYVGIVCSLVLVF